MDRSAIPDDKAPLFDAFDRLVNSVTPYVDLFTGTGESLKSTQTFLMQGLSNFLNFPKSEYGHFYCQLVFLCQGP